MDSGDSQGLPADASIALFQTAVDQFPTPWIAISHETHYNTGTNIAPVVIPMIRNAGYKFVTLAECLGMEAYSRKGGPMGVRDASWTCAGAWFLFQMADRVERKGTEVALGHRDSFSGG